jgi:hypothetical protein
VNRRNFSKLCASTMIAGLALDAPAWDTKTHEHPAERSDADAYVRREGMTWIIGTSRVEQKISLQDGHLRLNSFRNKRSVYEYRDHGSDPDQILLQIDGVKTSSTSWHWTLVNEHTQRLGQGELQLDIQLRGGPLEVTKHWVIYPHTAIIREWITIENVSIKNVRLEDLSFLNTRVLGASIDNLELSYVSGGGNFNGSQLLKTERLHNGYKRTLDSNIGIQTGSYSAYLPLLLLRDLRSKNSMAAGWDYLGHWSLDIGDHSGEQVGISLRVAGYDRLLHPGDRIETPRAFAAAVSGDLDDIGNQILDWQYRFFWDFTNPEYFGKTRWAVDWPNPWVGTGGTPSADNWGRRLSLDLRYVDLLRECGGDILWDDAGWYDSWGNWDGPDWRLTTSYLQKYGMRWVLWQPLFLATAKSRVAQEHPEWIIPGQMAFEQSISATRVWESKRLDADVASWKDFQWRYDIAPAASASDTNLLTADQEFRELLKQFKTSHPKSGVDACDGGGRWISYDLARFAESGECTDGGVGPYSGYYTSLLVSPDKLHNVCDFDHTKYNPSSDRIHLALNPTWYRDPGDGEDLESIRKDWEIYHYLIAQGVAGRWSHVFRPRVTGDDPIWYFQRMNAVGSSGVIITKHARTGSEYLMISKPLENTDNDRFEGGPTQMTHILTTKVASLDTGVYQDPIDNEFRYYGVPGEIYGPLNFRYITHQGEESYVTGVVTPGVSNPVNTRFFGMAFQVAEEPIIVTELGQFDPGNNRGVYSLMLIRAKDRAVLGSATLDMSQVKVDSSSFKYAKLREPIRLEPELDGPVIIYPNGLQPELIYDVRTYNSELRLRRSGAKLMADGIPLSNVLPGELIFLNLPSYPGSGIDKVRPTPPSNVTKRVGTNIGTQGIEISWSPPNGDNWISYYEILRNGVVLGKCAKGSFFFDHSQGARNEITAKYEVRTVNGGGGRSALFVAQTVSGDPETHQPLGEFWSSQGRDGWRYEQSFDGEVYEELTWRNEGYEGFWTGPGLGRIGRIWTQPSTTAEIARTFIAPRDGSINLSGHLQKDPSTDSVSSVLVRIEHNRERIWPALEWAIVPAFGKPMSHQIEGLPVLQGDAIRFIVKRNDENRAEPIIWNPIIVYG